MSEPLAYFNGNFLPASQLSLPVYDTGFVMGVAVSEQMRTFRGSIFRLEQHLGRLQHSLQIIGIEQAVTTDDLAAAAQRLVSENIHLLAKGDDLGISLFVTPGPYPTLAPNTAGGPTVGMHTYPLPFHLWESKYHSGQRLVVTKVRQVPAECWPTELKCRSRMHYYLADREAAERDPQARALLLDLDGHVTEASTANLVLYRRDRGLVSPPREMILPGVSVATLEELAARLGLPFRHDVMRVEDLEQADELLLCSTSPCVWPVLALDGRPVGSGRPGPVFEQLITAWGDAVGLDIRQQAARFAKRVPSASAD